jgi:hypothetical protein
MQQQTVINQQIMGNIMLQQVTPIITLQLLIEKIGTQNLRGGSFNGDVPKKLVPQPLILVEEHWWVVVSMMQHRISGSAAR